MLVVDDAGLAGAVGVFDERRVEGGDVGEGADDGVADEVGEADLGPGGAGQLVVEDLAVHLEEAGRDGADARRRRDAQAGLHIGHDPAGRPLEEDRFVRARRPRRAGRPPDRRPVGAAAGGGGRQDGGLDRNRLGRREGGGPIVGEELAPAVADRRRIDQKSVVHVVHQPRIGAERARRCF